MFDVIIIVLSEMKHLANLCDGRIKHNEIHGRQAFGNTFGFPLVLRLFHFRHQVVRPGKHRTARADCLAVGILGKEITIGIGGVVKLGIDDYLHLHTHSGRILSRKLGGFNLDFLNDNSLVKKFFKVNALANYRVLFNV